MLMDKERLLELLDTTYELEGLLHLMLSRDDINSTLEGLVVKKLELLSELAGLEFPVDSNDDMQEVFYEGEIPEKAELTDISEDTEAAVMNDCSEVQGDAESSEDSDKTDYSDVTGQSETVEVSENVREPEDAVNLIETSPGMSRKVMPAFSLNDKFLFTRELFNGSRDDFNESIDRLAEMETYEEAEEYFLDTLGWNPKDETVMDFMGIVAKYLDK